MGGMMNAKRYTGCRCCTDPDDVARRQIEKRDWKKEVEEEMTDDIGLLNNKEQAFVDSFIAGIRKEEQERIAKIVDEEYKLGMIDITSATHIIARIRSKKNG